MTTHDCASCRDRVTDVAVQAGRYGSLAFAISLMAAITTGYGVAAADDGTNASPSGVAAPSETGGDDGEGDTAGQRQRAASNRSKPRNFVAIMANNASQADAPLRHADPVTDVARTVRSRLAARHGAPGIVLSTGGAPASMKRAIQVPGLSVLSEFRSPLREPAPGEPPVAAKPAVEGDHPARPDPVRVRSSQAGAFSRAVADAVGNAQTTAGSLVDVVRAPLDPGKPVISKPAGTIAVGSVVGAVTALTSPAEPTDTPVEMKAVAAPVKLLSVVLLPLLDAGPQRTPIEPPIVWAVLAWVRRNFLNQSPVIRYNPETTSQGQLGVITGNVGAIDPERDPIKYTVIDDPEHGNVEIDQATGEFTYTPNLDYARQGGPDSFTVQVDDGKWNPLDFLRSDKGKATVTIDVDVDSIVPRADRYVVPIPSDSGISGVQQPAFTADGNALVFRATPTGASRSEIYRINTDGTGLQCLSCGLAPEVTGNLSKPFVFEDGNRILLSAGTQSSTGGETADHYILECNGGVNECGAGSQMVKINVPTQYANGVTVVQKERELRIAPDGEHVAFTQLLSAGTNTQLVSSVGTLQRTPTGYDIVDAHVVYEGGELKSFTPDGKGVIVTDFSGKYEAGNADDVLVDLRTGEVSRLTANLDYDESADMSPNGQWLALGSSRTLDYLTPMSQIERPTFVPAYIVFPVFQSKRGTLNQAWVVSREDELDRENGLYLGDPDWTSAPVANWSPDGRSVVFWERGATAENADQQQLVIAHLKNIEGGTAPSDVSTPDISAWAKPLSQEVPKATPLEQSRAGKVGGTATVVKTTIGNQTTTTVTYTDFEDEDGMILNGTESTVTNPTLTNITYNAHITVTDNDGTERGYLRATNVKITGQTTMTGVIESSLDGKDLVLGTPVV